MNMGMQRLLTLFMGLCLWGCQVKDIPDRSTVTPAPSTTAGPSQAQLTGGKAILTERFDGTTLDPRWRTTHAGWTIVDGAVHSTKARNAGLWLDTPLPEAARVEFDAWSAAPTGSTTFAGDLKCEIFADKPEHEAGYVLINGGWNNRLDVIARLDEHGEDRSAQAAHPVEPGTRYHWTVLRVDGTIYWYRDETLLMQYEDANPLPGRYFGFNNWESNAFFDNLVVYDLSTP
jgi:hypothetical protein